MMSGRAAYEYQLARANKAEAEASRLRAEVARLGEALRLMALRARSAEAGWRAALAAQPAEKPAEPAGGRG